MSKPAAESSVLLVDAGNTRVKWAIKRDGVLQMHGVHAYADGPISSAFEQAFEPTPKQSPKQSPVPPSEPPDKTTVVELPRTALIGSVASPEVEREIAGWLTAHRVISTVVEYQSKARLSVAYEEPSRLGIDRWLAMLGARSLCPDDVVVADCGTALTLDLVDKSGRHVGGLIAPGYHLMQRSLLTQTARIDEADQPWPDTIFGASTGAAVNAGATYALAALLDRFVDEARQHVGEQPIVLATGGGRDRLLRHARCDVMDVPDLVLLGLATLVTAGD